MAILIIAAITTAITITICATAAIPTVPSLQPDSPVVRGLMQNIYELGFVLTEVNLYLDTHPDDLEAIEYYAQIKDKYCDYMTQYADYYGPLDKLHISNDNYWMWVATPMPWEMEGC